MSKHRRIGFIVEGEKTEPQIINNMIKCFFNDNNFPIVRPEIITVPFGFSIYKLWKSVCEYDVDDFDIIDVIKEVIKVTGGNTRNLETISKDYFSELYLFFDYDGHVPIKRDANRSEMVNGLLNIFDNETENGQLLLSYPMVEAINGMKEENICTIPEECKYSIPMGKMYKCDSKSRVKVVNFSFTKRDWEVILATFVKKISCLFEHSVKHSYYKKEVSPISIFDKQSCKYINKNEVMILSAFPEFLLDYFDDDFWRSRQFANIEAKNCVNTGMRV